MINLVANIVSYSTTVLVAFILTPFLVKTIGVESYSFYPLAQNTANYIGIITIALNSMAARFITIEYVKEDYKEASTYYTSVFGANILAVTILLVPMALILIYINTIFNVPAILVQTVRLTFFFVFISFIVQTISSVFSVATFVKNRISYRSVVEIIQAIVRVLLYLLLYTLFKPSIVYVGIVAVILSLIYSVCHYLFTKRLIPEIKIKKDFFNFKYIKRILSSGVWNSINNLGTMLMLSISIILANTLINAKAGGEYAIIQTVPTFISGIVTMLAVVFSPSITYKYALNDKSGLISEVQNAQKILGLITNIPVAVFIAVGYAFFSLWVPGEDSNRLQILSIMAMAHWLVNGVMWPIFLLNTTMNKVKVPALILVVSGVFNVTLAVLLIELTRLGVFAIALSVLVSSILYYALFIPLYASKCLEVRKSTFYNPLFKNILGAGVIYLITLLITRLITISSWTSLFIVCGISGVLGLVVNALLVFNRQQRKDIFCASLKKLGIKFGG